MVKRKNECTPDPQSPIEKILKGKKKFAAVGRKFEERSPWFAVVQGWSSALAKLSIVLDR
jgi:hypothetical protein